MALQDDCVEVSVDHVEQWAEVTALALVTTRIKAVEAESRKPFMARMRAMRLGASQLSDISYGSLLSQRTPRLIRQSDPEYLQVAVITSGRQGIEQAGNTALLGRGDMVLYDSSRPFDAFTENSPGGDGSVLLQFPKTLLSLPAHRLNDLLAVPLCARRGVGRLLAQFLTTAASEYDACEPSDSTRLGTTAVDLVTAMVSHHLDAESALSSTSRQRVLYTRALSFIDEHLGSADLTPSAVAAVHYVSLRSLQRIFQEHGTTVSEVIRSRRLQRCRRDLADPSLRRQTVHAIASRWGFPRPAEFSRAFRAATGTSPSGYRAQHALLVDDA